MTKNLNGGSSNWNNLPMGVNGIIIAKATIPRVLKDKSLLGLLL
jgi:hypothetical protein